MRKCIVLFGAALILLGGCAKAKYVAGPNEEIYGTWTNEKMDFKKVAMAPEGKYMYLQLADTTPFEESTGQIAAKWTDSEGSVWYKFSYTRTKGPHAGSKFTELDKLSKSGKVWEYVWTAPANDAEMKNPSYPTKIDPQDYLYSVYYRAQ